MKRRNCLFHTTFLSAAAVALLFAPRAQAVPVGLAFSQAFNPTPIGPGSSSQLVFTIINPTANDATDVAFSDPLPAGVTVAAAPGISSDCGGTMSAVAGGDTIALSGGVIHAAMTCKVKVNVTAPNTAGSYPNPTGHLTSSFGDSGTSTDTLVVDIHYPGLPQYFTPSSAPPHQTVLLTFEIDNSQNPDQLTAWTYTEPVPPNLEFVSLTPVTNTCSTPPLPAGATCIVTYHVYAKTLGAIENVTDPFLFSSAAGSNLTAGFSTATLTGVSITQVPTLNVWALIVLAGLLLLSASWLLRR